MEEWLGEYLWWFFPIFFVGLWLAIFAGAARWGGWTVLAAAYPSHGEPSGQRFRMRSAQLRAGCNYNNCIHFSASPIGLHMSMPAVFSFRHPPIFVPWAELRTREEHAWRIHLVVLQPARCPEIPIKIRRKLAHQLFAAGGMQPDQLAAD